MAENKDALGQILRGANPAAPVDGQAKLKAEKNVPEKKTNLKKIKLLNLPTFSRK